MCRLWIFQEELAARIPEQHAALLNKKEMEDISPIIRPSRPEPEPPHPEVSQPLLFFTHESFSVARQRTVGISELNILNHTESEGVVIVRIYQQKLIKTLSYRQNV